MWTFQFDATNAFDSFVNKIGMSIGMFYYLQSQFSKSLIYPKKKPKKDNGCFPYTNDNFSQTKAQSCFLSLCYLRKPRLKDFRMNGTSNQYWIVKLTCFDVVHNNVDKWQKKSIKEFCFELTHLELFTKWTLHKLFCLCWTSTYVQRKIASNHARCSFYPKCFFSGQVAPKIKAMMMEKGSTMVGYQPLKEKPNFFR